MDDSDDDDGVVESDDVVVVLLRRLRLRRLVDVIVSWQLCFGAEAALMEWRRPCSPRRKPKVVAEGRGEELWIVVEIY